MYAESSAVLAWMLGQSRGAEVLDLLQNADDVAASVLTVLECTRSVVVAACGGRITQAAAAKLQAEADAVFARWSIVPMHETILERAGRPFPTEPLRTLDAIHLASALYLSASASDLALLSLDDRVRRCGMALGFEVLPAGRS